MMGRIVNPAVIKLYSFCCARTSPKTQNNTVMANINFNLSTDSEPLAYVQHGVSADSIVTANVIQGNSVALGNQVKILSFFHLVNGGIGSTGSVSMWNFIQHERIANQASV